jgi:(R,R)-butanediol dehydrogenase / meso-butanediol dehydrogenase / diacetyl reductase
MRLVNIHGPSDVRVDEVAEPVVGPSDVLMKVAACGVCGSDITFAKVGVQRPHGQPWPLGHEAAGEIVEAGAAVRDIPIGMRALINPMGVADNVIGNGGSEGAFADYLVIREAKLGHSLLEIPAQVSYDRAALVEPLAVALHGVNRSGAGPDDKTVVFGAGPIGLGAVFWLRRKGVKSIIAVDLSDARLDIARKMGASDVIDAGREDVMQRLGEIHGTVPTYGSVSVGTDVFFDMAGGNVAPRLITMAKFGARLTLTAIYPAPVPIDLQLAVVKELRIITSVGYPDELPVVLQTLAKVSDEEIAPYVSHTFPFDRFAEAFETAKQPTSAKVMVEFSQAVRRQV